VARAPRLAGVRADYDRALKQRNALLRSASMLRRGSRSGQQPDLSTLDVWDAHLAAAGAHLLGARLDLVHALGPLIGDTYATIAGSGRAVVDYRASWLSPGTEEPPEDRASIEHLLSQALTAARPNEVERGITLVGPHRDDLALSLDLPGGQLGAKSYASHGESWSLALSLKLAGYELLRTDGIEPVLILDDVFAELDASRRAHLVAVAAGAEQVLITAAVPEDVPAELGGVRYSVSMGSAQRVG
jgi:DNA replication and repair protein RecF